MANHAGFSLHAGVRAEAHQRDKLERLCRYISRPAVCEKRLALTTNGQVRYELKTPYRNGTTHVIFEPLDFMTKLAALAPKPRFNLTRFRGVFAPNSKHRVHQLEGLEKGQLCPECEKGRLYKYEPASFVRIVGHPPLSAERHVIEQLRCALCSALFTAPLPEEVLNDGVRGQQYAYSARAVMVLNKFFMGSPYFRQENMQKLLGESISASTIYDQCAHLARDC